MKVLNINPRTLPEARTELEAGNAEIARLDTELTAAKSAAPDVKASTEYKELETKFNTQTEELRVANEKVTNFDVKASTEYKELETQLTTTRADLKAANEKVEKLPKMAQDKAIELLAAKGLGPIDLGLDSQGEKPDTSKLKGSAKAAAAFKTQPEVAQHRTKKTATT